MSEIEEGDKVVTPEGKIKEAKAVKEWPNTPTEIMVDDEEFVGQPAGQWMESRLVQVDRPIRVRVSREKQAEDLVAFARECGFNFDEEVEIYLPNYNYPINLVINNESKYIGLSGDYDLTYRDDLPQIEAWLEYHSESEDECDTCHGTTTGRIGPSHTQYDCPNCTDESEDYDEPRPEDRVWREKYRDFLNGNYEGSPESESERLGFDGATYGGTNQHIFDLLDALDNLQYEIQDCWENQQEYKDDVAELHRQNAEFRERIEEARGLAKDHLSAQHKVEVNGLAKDILEILSDSDEGDGCEAKNA